MFSENDQNAKANLSLANKVIELMSRITETC